MTASEEDGFFSALSGVLGETWRDVSEFVSGIEEEEEDVALSSATGRGYSRTRSEDTEISLAASSGGLRLGDFPDLRPQAERRGRELDRLEHTAAKQEEQATLMRTQAAELRQAVESKKSCCTVL